jgi:hypothetical protein
MEELGSPKKLKKIKIFDAYDLKASMSLYNF